MKLSATLLAAPAALLLSAPASHAAILSFDAVLTGPQESPPNTSPGSGFATVEIDELLHTMEINISFAGLEGTTTASHIHCCTAPPGTAMVATAIPWFPGFPIGVMAGSFSSVFDLTLASTYNPAFVTAHGGTVAGAEDALVMGIKDGTA